ncbi:hypothetical protein [Allomuricauda sp. NBRC 101325]|uniref:hypothetical protein n=1 Tax=Allomuricauda sp. NBRC 101325 TaxID=1113758 RepID=UPI0024A4DD79|nr:hypothetical protein [Muricauda sp. NBRC 101325]GLU44735.1 hypothetical protein Musp01_23590 [Muricauda sp. NBRC 101325]
MNNSQQLRIDFIGMAFALAIGQVGFEIGEFYSSGLIIWEHPYVFSHLFLGTYIIASSWVGWNRSKSKGTFEVFNGNFGKSFIILLLDLFLVICYFIIIKGVEKPYLNKFSKLDISAIIELDWSLIIVVTYIVWDVVSKLFDFDSEKFKFKLNWKQYLARAYQAVLCFILLWLMSNEHDKINSIDEVFLVDFYILLIFVLFRALKEDFKEDKKHTKVVLIKRLLFIFLPSIIILGIYLRIKFDIFLFC